MACAAYHYAGGGQHDRPTTHVTISITRSGGSVVLITPSTPTRSASAGVNRFVRAITLPRGQMSRSAGRKAVMRKPDNSQPSRTTSGQARAALASSISASQASSTASGTSVCSNRSRRAARISVRVSAINTRSTGPPLTRASLLLSIAAIPVHGGAWDNYTAAARMSYRATGEHLAWPPGEGSAWLGDQMLAGGQHHGLGPATDAELGEDTADVELDRRAADGEAVGDLRVAQPVDQQRQHPAPTRREVIPWDRRLARGVHERCCRLGRQRRSPGIRRTDRGCQLVGTDVLEQVADGAGLQRPLHDLVRMKAGQGYDLHIRIVLPDVLRGRRTVHSGHHQIHQHHIRLYLPAQLHCFSAAAGFACQQQVTKGQQKRGQPAADDRVIVDHQHADRLLGHAAPPSAAVPGAGQSTVTCVPLPGWLASSSIAPMDAARSYIIRTPK